MLNNLTHFLLFIFAVYGILRETCADFRLSVPNTVDSASSAAAAAAAVAAAAFAAGSYPHELSSAYQELHLIFTMVLHHPAFTFEEKTQLGNIYICLQSRLPGLRPPSPIVTPAPTPSPPESLIMPPTAAPPTSRSPTNGRSNNTKSTGNTVVNHSSSARNKTRQSVQHGNHHINRSNSNNGSSAYAVGESGKCSVNITSLLREQLGKDGHHQKHHNPYLPKEWLQFENLSASELATYSDLDFESAGLSSGFIALLRKLLDQQQHARSHPHQQQHGSRPNSRNGLVDDCGIYSKVPIVAQQQHGHHQGVTNKQLPSGPQRPNLVKTCMGPPNVQPAFNNAQRSQVMQAAEAHQKHKQQQQEAPLSRAGSASSSGSSSLEACSPPSSPTDSSTVAHRSGEHHRKPFNAPQPVVLPSGNRSCKFQRLNCAFADDFLLLQSGIRPQGRGPSASSTGPRGSNNGVGFIRPSSTLPSTTVNSSSSSLHRHQTSCSSSSSSCSSSSSSSTSSTSSNSSSSSTSRSASQPREMPYPVSVSYSAPLQQQQQQVVGAAAAANAQQPAAAPFIVDSSTPPPQLDAQPTATALPVYSYHGYLPMNGK